jgi:hypothetical protein
MGAPWQVPRAGTLAAKAIPSRPSKGNSFTIGHNPAQTTELALTDEVVICRYRRCYDLLRRRHGIADTKQQGINTAYQFDNYRALLPEIPFYSKTQNLNASPSCPPTDTLISDTGHQSKTSRFRPEYSTPTNATLTFQAFRA